MPSINCPSYAAAYEQFSTPPDTRVYVRHLSFVRMGADELMVIVWTIELS